MRKCENVTRGFTRLVQTVSLIVGNSDKRTTGKVDAIVKNAGNLETVNFGRMSILRL